MNKKDWTEEWKPHWKTKWCKMPKYEPIYELELAEIDDTWKHRRFTIHADGKLIWDEELKMEGLVWWSEQITVANLDNAPWISGMLFGAEGQPSLLLTCLIQNEKKITGTTSALKTLWAEFMARDSKSLVKSRQENYLTVVRS